MICLEYNIITLNLSIQSENIDHLICCICEDMHIGHSEKRKKQYVNEVAKQVMTKHLWIYLLHKITLFYHKTKLLEARIVVYSYI